MDKRIVAVGVIILVLSFVVAGSVVGPSITSNVNYNNTQVNRILVKPNTTVTDAIQMYNSSFFVLSYTSSVPVDFYFLNQTGKKIFDSFNSLESNSVNSISLNSLEGKGLYLFIQNGTKGTTYPYSSNLSVYGYKKPTYFYNGTIFGPGSAQYQNGTYFLEFNNRNSSYANVSYKYDEYPLVNLNQSSYYGNMFVPGSLVSSVMFILGIVLIVFGVLRKSYSRTELQNYETKVSEFYKNIDTKSSKRKTSNKHKKSSKKSKRKSRK